VTEPAIRRFRIAVVSIALFVLASCGIKGPLELPEGAQVSDNEGKGRSSPGAMRATELPGYQPTRSDLRINKGLGVPVKRDEPFVLDPLLN
jgi:predicted small lipoprotein YifL